MQRQLCPYGNILQAYQKQSIKLARPIHLCVGEKAWQEAKSNLQHGFLSTLLPSDKKFTDFEWPFKHQRIVIDNTGGVAKTDLKKIAYQCLVAGADSVVIFSANMPVTIINKTDLKGF